MVRSYRAFLICLTMLTSTMLFGIAFGIANDSAKEHKMAVAMYSAHTQLKHAMQQRMALLKNYYLDHAQEPITRAQAITAVLAGATGFGIYRGICALVQKLRGAAHA